MAAVVRIADGCQSCGAIVVSDMANGILHNVAGRWREKY
jgi:hypothetical protein